MRLYYRISDKSYEKTKLIGATKEVCLMNFVKVFQDVVFGKVVPPPDSWETPMRIYADRCERKTNTMLISTGIPVEMTDLGNAGSLIHVLEQAISTQKDDEIAYFCEDDYLHMPLSPQLLVEGLGRSDYVTLYDHPDKYTADYNLGEYSKVIKTKSSHWRYTISTCMTFGVKIKKLREDIEIWKKHTTESHPHDHQIFSELSKKGRRLAVCIPGAACHTDLEYSVRKKMNLIEPWAIELMIKQLEFELGDRLKNEDKNWLSSKTGIDLLVALDALRKT